MPQSQGFKVLNMGQTSRQHYQAIHQYTIDSCQARPFTRPDTAIQDLYTTQKRHLLKPASSSLGSTECQ